MAVLHALERLCPFDKTTVVWTRSFDFAQDDIIVSHPDHSGGTSTICCAVINLPSLADFMGQKNLFLLLLCSWDDEDLPTV